MSSAQILLIVIYDYDVNTKPSAFLGERQTVI